jgi:hypothetical protein
MKEAMNNFSVILHSETLGITQKSLAALRGDEGGEGGAGHRAATALLSIYGINSLELMEDSVEYTENAADYQAIVDKVIEMAKVERPRIPIDQRPQYVDWVFALRFGASQR